jgi:hypothetical protein
MSSKFGAFRGWLGFALGLLPVLQLIPIPAVQIVVAEFNGLVLPLLGVSGVGLLASSPAIVGKAKE